MRIIECGSGCGDQRDPACVTLLRIRRWDYSQSSYSHGPPKHQETPNQRPQPHDLSGCWKEMVLEQCVAQMPLSKSPQDHTHSQEHLLLTWTHATIGHTFSSRPHCGPCWPFGQPPHVHKPCTQAYYHDHEPMTPVVLTLVA